MFKELERIRENKKYCSPRNPPQRLHLPHAVALTPQTLTQRQQRLQRSYYPLLLR